MRRSTTDHNGYMRGSYYYVSHYRRGVVVYDAADPNQLVEVAHFDNYVTPSSNVAGTDGTWGVYPFLPSGNLLVSDIENGLFVLRDHTQHAESERGSGRFRRARGERHRRCAERRPRPRAARRRSRRQRQRAVQRDGGLRDRRRRLRRELGHAVVGRRQQRRQGHRHSALPDDTTIEGAETLTVTLSSPTNGATLDGSSILTVTITDNDSSAPPRGSGGGGGGSIGPRLARSCLRCTLLISRARRRASTDR